MDEAVALVVSAATIGSLPLGLAPGRSRTNLVNGGTVGELLLAVEFVQ